MYYPERARDMAAARKAGAMIIGAEGTMLGYAVRDAKKELSKVI